MARPVGARSTSPLPRAGGQGTAPHAPMTFFSRPFTVPFLLLLALLTTATGPAAAGTPGGTTRNRLTIALRAPAALRSHPVSRTAMDDAVTLLRRGFPHAVISRTARTAQVSINLVLDDRTVSSRVRPDTCPPAPFLFPYPAQQYSWHAHPTPRGTELTLTAPSPEAISFGLYGLLQEKLGYAFIHPRQTLIPNHRRWPLPRLFTWQADPRFPRRGFHLHTLHPTELAEHLANPDHPGALAGVREYVDWLARNQQNIMQFYLVRTVDRRRWPGHARAIVSHAHSRGVRVGVAFSLSMLQQQAFQAMHPLRFHPSYRRQIDDSLAWLFQIPWDFVTMEPTLGEHLPDLAALLPKTHSHLITTATGTYRTPVFYATHVIRRRRDSTLPSPDRPGTGVLIHTVMNYAVTEEAAPVYGNRDLRFMLERAERERKLRETWFWPESSYWVAYDTSVPLFLLSYLQARWTDMQTMAGLGIAGHLTFSSGWEWGYWLTDWSIARWSWQHRINGRAVPQGPTDCLELLFPHRDMAVIWRTALAVENEYLKERGLIAYLAAAPPFAEMPRLLRRPFQPTPPFTYRRLFRQASRDEASAALSPAIAGLTLYGSHLEQLCRNLDRAMERHFSSHGADPRLALAREVRTGLAMTALRARHRALTLKALVLLKPGAAHAAAARQAGLRALADAAALRRQALALVAAQESRYRYPVEHIARRRPSMTAYQFGYLYPVSTLHFWEREEEQVRSGRFDPFFMNIWDFRRILGLESLW